MDERARRGVVLVAVGTIGLLTLGILQALIWPAFVQLSSANPSFPSPVGMWAGGMHDMMLMMGVMNDMAGMMGRWNQQSRTSNPITIEQATRIAEDYLSSLNNPDLGIKEVMEFERNFYITYYEKTTDVGAFEMLIWKEAPSSGMMGGSMGMMSGGMMGSVIMPEPGPNMMWNTNYSPMANMMGQGMMGDMMGRSTNRPTGEPMTVSKEQAEKIAKNYLDRYFPGSQPETITIFYGYYTIDFEKDDKIVGMLSVNTYTGRVWYHSWHGAFLRET